MKRRISSTGSADRKGVNYNGSNQESSEEAGKEDRKEEIVSTSMHTHIFWLEEKFFQPSFCLFAVFLDMKLYFAEKFK